MKKTIETKMYKKLSVSVVAIASEKKTGYMVKVNHTPIPLLRKMYLCGGDAEKIKTAKELKAKNAADCEFEKIGVEVIKPKELLCKAGFDAEFIENIFVENDIDKRSRAYLEAVKQNLGMIEHRQGWDGIKFDTEFAFNYRGHEVECGHDAQGNWVAEFGYRIGTDDYQVETMLFSTKPTTEMVKTADLISDVETVLLFGKRKAVFTCWECGCPDCHWLDSHDPSDTSFRRKVAMLMDQYCGC